MISNKTAQRMGVKFFKEQKLNPYADMLEARRYCLASLFRVLVGEQGKLRVYTLYSYLPKQLRYYVLKSISHAEFAGKLRDVDRKYKRVWNSNRPERCKDFCVYMQELQEVLFKFLAS